VLARGEPGDRPVRTQSARLVPALSVWLRPHMGPNPSLARDAPAAGASGRGGWAQAGVTGGRERAWRVGATARAILHTCPE
jgi:hypothetical protein